MVENRQSNPGAEGHSICIIAHNACGAMRGGSGGHIGGAEHQTTLMARWLAARGYRVSLLTWDEGLENESVIDGVKMVNICSPDGGIPGLRFIHPRGTGLFAAMRRAEADVYYHNSAEGITGMVAGWCKRNGKRFVYSVASDVACERSLPTLNNVRDRFLYRYGLKHADRIIVQTNRQERLLQTSFGLASRPLPMPCGFQAAPNPDESLPARPPRVAWIGRIDHMKRLEWALDLAERLPHLTFDIVGAKNTLPENSPVERYARELIERAGAIDNVDWRGSLQPAEVREVLKTAHCLCCTSSYEGFPNTFLEAWSQARPVVSSFDPDCVIERHGLGVYASDVDGLADAIESLVESEDEWKQKSKAAISYFREFHSLEVAMPRFEDTLVFR